MKTLKTVGSLVAWTALVAACDVAKGPAGPGRSPLTAELESAPAYSDWSAAVNLGPVINSTFNENHPAISKDGLSLYFTSSRPGGYGATDLWVSHRAGVGDPWSAPENLGPEINSASSEVAPTFSQDGHRLYFHSERPGGCGSADLYVARRRDKGDDFDWRAAENLGCVVNTPYFDAGPTIFEDEVTGITTLYYTIQNRPGGLGDFDVYQSTRVGDDGEFGPPALVLELSGPFRDTRTAISRDGLAMYVSSDVGGRVGGIGSQDVWIATRSGTSDPWGTLVNLGPAVNTTAFDGAPAISFDGTELYFFSERAGGFGGRDLYVTTRTRLGGAEVVAVTARQK